MPFSINEIKSSLKFGGARGTLFRVHIFNPVNPLANFDMPFKVRATALPEMVLGTIPVFYFGRAIKVAGDRPPPQPWECTVINDEDFLIRQGLEEWNNAINSLEGNIREFPGSQAALYKSQGQIQQFDKTGNIIREYTMKGIWPSQISPIQLDWGAQDTIEEFGVTFEYDSWEVTGGNTGSFEV